MHLGESLQAFAARTHRTIRAAYADWHTANNATARSWIKPFARAGYTYVEVGGGRCLGLLPIDLIAVEREAAGRETVRRNCDEGY